MGAWGVMIRKDYVILVLSCDKYEPCWRPFFTLLDKYWEDHPKVYLVTESKKCEYCDTINVDSEFWGKRFKTALENIKSKQVLVMLDDFFIRGPVDSERIYAIEFEENDICYNFELEYREPKERMIGWDLQKDNQVYLTSTQPSLWDREKLLGLIKDNMSPWEFELQYVSSPYNFYINNQDFIIDIGYRHQDLSVGWGITRGKLSKECLEFLGKEGLSSEIVDYYALL